MEPEQKGERRLTVRKAAQAPVLMASFHAPAAKDARMPALELLVRPLGDGDSSRLHRKLVEEAQVALRVNVMLDEGFDPGLLTVHLDLPPGIRYRIGCWLADTGQEELAFRALLESVREDGATPGSAGALYRAGQLAWERMKSASQAREAWERLLEQFPDSPWSDAARDGLRQLPSPG